MAANASSSATSSSSTSNGSATATSESHGVSAAPIVGGVLGAVLGLGLMALGIYLVVRRRRQAYSKLVDEGTFDSPTRERAEETHLLGTCHGTDIRENLPP